MRIGQNHPVFRHEDAILRACFSNEQAVGWVFVQFTGQQGGLYCDASSQWNDLEARVRLDVFEPCFKWGGKLELSAANQLANFQQ